MKPLKLFTCPHPWKFFTLPWQSLEIRQQRSPGSRVPTCKIHQNKRETLLDQHGHQTTPLIRTMPKVGFSMREGERQRDWVRVGELITNISHLLYPFPSKDFVVLPNTSSTNRISSDQDCRMTFSHLTRKWHERSTEPAPTPLDC